MRGHDRATLQMQRRGFYETARREGADAGDAGGERRTDLVRHQPLHMPGD
jgi:hypothetical protein